MSRLRRTIVPLALCLCGLATGCQTPIQDWPARLFHELKPHRLSRLNQGASLGREHANFSVSDTIADRAAADRGAATSSSGPE